MSAGLDKSVCIIGAGAFGLVALKNLLEEGFDATAYERNDHIGGLWHVSSDPTQTTALSGTVSNASKYTGCYSDFPFAETTRLHPTAREVQLYLESYAASFGLWRRIKLSTSVVNVERDGEQRKWLVTIRCGGGDTRTVAFDRLVIATGANSKPVIIGIGNVSAFGGELLHSQLLKYPTKYAGQTVVVVGAGQTAADTLEFLRRGGAKKLYLSHRRSFMLLPRMLGGKPSESIVTLRFLNHQAREQRRYPTAAERAGEEGLDALREAVWPGLKGHPAFADTREKPLLHASLPVICDSLADNLLSGAVESVQPIDRILGPAAVVLKDGKVLQDVDATIVCSGNGFDFSDLVPREFDPTNAELALEKYDILKSTKFYREDVDVPRVYRRFLSMQEPQSLAFLGHAISKTTIGLFPFYDLITMALAQLWKGTAPMPSTADMEQECDQYFGSLREMLDKSEISHTGIVHDLEFDLWLHEVAGTQVPATLGGGGWREWRMWLSNRKVYELLMDGVNSPHAMRLFQSGKRQAWDGALDAIVKANRDIDARAEQWKQQQTAQGPG